MAAGQESGLRSGTEATGQIAALPRRVELRADHLDEKLAHVAAIKAYAEEKLLALDGVVRIGDGTAPHILSSSLVGYPSANVVTELGAQGMLHLGRLRLSSRAAEPRLPRDGP